MRGHKIEICFGIFSCKMMFVCVIDYDSLVLLFRAVVLVAWEPEFEPGIGQGRPWRRARGFGQILDFLGRVWSSQVEARVSWSW